MFKGFFEKIKYVRDVLSARPHYHTIFFGLVCAVILVCSVLVFAIYSLLLMVIFKQEFAFQDLILALCLVFVASLRFIVTIIYRVFKQLEKQLGEDLTKPSH